MKTFFIAGTDTDVGKTYVTVGLLNQLRAQGYSTIAMKPVATGGSPNADALQLQTAASIKLDYAQVNPFTFIPPVSPNIAATLANDALSVNRLIQHCQPVFSIAADYCLIEGIGGWHTPLNNKETMADFVVQLQLPVILVIAIRLGCLNHSILTANAIQQKTPLFGWIANFTDPDILHQNEIFATLQQHLQAPCLASIAHHQNVYCEAF